MSIGRPLSHGHSSGRNSTESGGERRTRTYISWESMKGRCLNPKNASYEYYGGRGVTLCESWGSFENFLADMGERPDGMTLDRIDPDGNYEPNNCRWADPRQQALNKRAGAAT